MRPSGKYAVLSLSRQSATLRVKNTEIFIWKKGQLTTAEKRKLKIEQLKARLQKEESRLNAQLRKERTGQLMAFGIYLEAFLKVATPEERELIRTRMGEILEGRNLERALAGLARIERGRNEK